MSVGGKREGAGRKKGVPNKVKSELAELAREYTSEALEALVRVIRAPKAPPASVVAAATAILDRGHGKPSQVMEMTGKNGQPIQVNIVGDDARLL
jgi:hypothetical protein